jgi:hypothetical protein
MFEQASRLKLRFRHNGAIGVEDLWDLTLDSLNTLAKALNKELKESSEENFIDDKSPKDKVTELKFEIVKHVIGVKKSELAAAKDRKDKQARRRELLQILNEKETADLRNKSREDLIKELEALDA